MRGEVRAKRRGVVGRWRGRYPKVKPAFLRRETRVPGPAFRALAARAALSNASAERSWPLACS
eukprot:scaffold96312_cov42-Phaeocystis_antarctica.AAC.1